jgi:hypothetical protein
MITAQQVVELFKKYLEPLGVEYLSIHPRVKEYRAEDGNVVSKETTYIVSYRVKVNDSFGWRNSTLDIPGDQTLPQLEGYLSNSDIKYSLGLD